MNQALSSLYSSKWNNLMNATKTILADEGLGMKPTNPLLLYIDNEEDYQSADIKLMIFGQETNNWYDERGASVGDVQKLYDGFFNTKECYKYGGHFWNGIKRFISLLQAKYPDKKIRLIWNNIVKIGKQSKGLPPDYIYEIERKEFKVIPTELEILKPNVVIFLTGPNYDSVIKDNFGDVNYEALSNSTERQLSRLTLKGVEFAYRTYHPQYLFFNKIDDYFDTIIDDMHF